MRKVVIIHGWESNPNDHLWYQEEKVTLEKMGYTVFTPQMPGGSFVKEDEWVETINDLKPDEDTVLIGHSLGAPTILRFLEKATDPVGKVFLIAGFASPLTLNYPNEEHPRKFVERPFDWEKIRRMASEFIILNQDHDQWVPFEKGKELADNLGGKLIKVEGTDHFDKMDLRLINKELL
jgi:predicted alpha/beta hydrolase family esterase